MTYKIPENIRQTVIRLSLEGNSRKHIAVTCGVSEGTVSNIIADWRQKLGYGDADALRELGINMKRAGIDAAQCAQGFRISMILRKTGIDEETFESFLLNIYQPCDRAGLTGDKIGSYLEDLFKFSKEEDTNNNNGGNPIKLSEIPYYIQQMKNEENVRRRY